MSPTAESSSIAKELFSVEELRRLTGLARTTLYAEIRAGRLVARKVGRRTVVLRRDFENWAAELPRSR
jgi:excisionase family DNA binding protein